MDLRFGIVLQNLSPLLTGLELTLWASGVALAIGIAGGLVACAAQLTSAPWLAAGARVYIGAFRTVPEALLVYWVYFCTPFIMAVQLDGFWAGSVALGIVASAYFAEIFRAGIQAVPRGQIEAARALSLPRRAIWGRVIGPQAFRLIIPPLINYIADLVKNTTVLATIGVGELAFQAYQLGAVTFRYFEFLTAIAIAYFVVLSSIALCSRVVERSLEPR